MTELDPLMRTQLLAALVLLFVACDRTPTSSNEQGSSTTDDKPPVHTPTADATAGAGEGAPCTEQRACKFGLQCDDGHCTDPRGARLCKGVARRQGFSNPHAAQACLIFVERIKARLDHAAFDRFAICARDKASVLSFPDCIPSASDYVGVDEIHAEVVNIQLQRLTQAVQAYQKSHSAPPKDLDALVADQRLEDIPQDPWGKRFRLSIQGSLIIVESSGPDLNFGSDDDVVKRVVF